SCIPCRVTSLFGFSLLRYVSLRALPSFPTRRSSDLYVFKVAAVDAEKVTLDDGRAIRRGYLNIDQGVCLTSHASQCRTVRQAQLDRKSTRLNSSHGSISYAVFCLKKKKQ